MSITTERCRATPGAVWAVLADPDCYGSWVVGAKDVRDADPGFPAVGTRFFHSVGVGLIHIQDESAVLVSDPRRLLVLEVKARPLGRARVELALQATGDGCVIEMREAPISPLSRVWHNPIADRVLHARNVEALRRLRRLAEGTLKAQPTSRSRRAPGGHNSVPATAA